MSWFKWNRRHVDPSVDEQLLQVRQAMTDLTVLRDALKELTASLDAYGDSDNG